MKDQLFGMTVRDIRTGLVGRIVGIVEWESQPQRTLIVQPKANADGSVPASQYVPETTIEVLPEPIGDMIFKQ
jgi:hypothetical protein